ncbi:MAG: nitroreductase family protein [Acidimicrobiales bacterium]
MDPARTAASAGFDVAQADRLLTTTRAVRKRLDLARPVDLDVVLDCLRRAIQAPTGGNIQGWRWMVVDDPSVRAGLADLYRRSFEPYIASRREVIATRGGDTGERVVRSSEYLADHLHDVPVHVIPCVLGRLPERPSTADCAGFFGSVLPAAWSFILALRSRGLGSVFTTLHLVYEKEAAELLGIPDTVTQVGLIPVAHTIGADFRPAARRPIEEITYRNRWKSPVVAADPA